MRRRPFAARAVCWRRWWFPEETVGELGLAALRSVAQRAVLMEALLIYMVELRDMYVVVGRVVS